MAATASVGAVVLSMGTRPQELAAALASLSAQRGVRLDILVVGNGWVPSGLPAGVRSLALEHNLGVPEGRNVGAAAVTGDVIFFFDDDARLPSDDVLARLVAVLAAHPRTAIVQPRAVDPDGRPSPRRWVPRLRVRAGRAGVGDTAGADVGDTGGAADPGGVVAGVWEGVFVIRRAAFEQAGGWPGHFFYAHEGVELVWRLYDAGWDCRYAPEILVHHPATDPRRHAVYYRMNARNRVWVARRNLPAPLVPVYVLTWVLVTMVRVRSPRDLLVWFGGLVEGLRTASGERRPMRWSTVVRLTLAGRPPVI